MKYLHFSRNLVPQVAYLFCSLLLADHAAADDYRECVGRYELAFPAKVDAATTASAAFDGKFIKYPIQFADGKQTMYSSFAFNGRFDIIQGVSNSWIQNFLKKSKDFVAASKTESNADKRFAEIPTDRPNSFIMSGLRASEFNIYNGRVIR